MATRTSELFSAKSDLAVPDARLRALREGDGGITAEAAASAAARAGLRVRAVAPLAAQGTFHRLFRVTHDGGIAILRASLPLGDGQRDDGLRLDAACHAWTRAAGVPGPAVLHVTVGDGPFDFELLEEARGVCLRELDRDEEAMREALRAIGAALARVHTCRGFGHGPLDPAALPGCTGRHEHWDAYVQLRLDEHLRICAGAGLLDREQLRGFERGLRDSFGTPRPALLHGDPGSHNFFVDGGAASAILDWEDALLGDPVFDLALWATFQPRRRHAAMFEGYGFVPDSGTGARFWRYFVRHTLAKAVHRIRFGYPDVPGRPTLRERLAEAAGELERTCALA